MNSWINPALLSGIAYPPRYYQSDAVGAIFDYFNNQGGRGNPLILMPTGTGKSIVIALFVFLVMQYWPGQRIIIGTHSKELVKQNGKKLAEMWPGAPMGIHSEGLKQRDVSQPVIYGGIQSMIANVTAFGHRDLLIIDEAQMVGDKESEWLAFIAGLRVINPRLKVIGLTATGFRMGLGMLTNGPIFTDIIYDLTSLESFNRLVAEGYLAHLISPKLAIGIDDRGIKTASNGDYNQSQAEKAAMKVTREAILDASKYRFNRHSWLVFSGGIEHAERTAYMLNEIGIRACAVHSGNKEFPMKAKEADERLEAYMRGEYQACVNYGKLTTGFDHPAIDLIMMLRLTKSAVLWVQMLGRGTRPFGGDGFFPPKANTLVLDYARNIEKLGPINDPVIPRKKGEGSGEAPIKVCDCCGGYNHISARWCVVCGEEFEFSVKVKKTADHTNEPLRDATPELEYFEVERAFYRRHVSSQSGLASLCVSYTVKGRMQPIVEYVHIESEGSRRGHAEQWWMKRTHLECPTTISQALDMQLALRTPARLLVHSNTKFPSIERVEYD